MTRADNHHRIWRDGKFVNWEDATMHVMSHVVHYGSSVFEGIRCYATPNGPAIFRLPITCGVSSIHAASTACRWSTRRTRSFRHAWTPSLKTRCRTATCGLWLCEPVSRWE